jgi:hypothetical protein
MPATAILSDININESLFVSLPTDRLKVIISRDKSLQKQAIFFASKYGNLEVVKFLIEKKMATINDKDDMGNTVLVWSIVKGRQEIAEYLINQGADLNAYLQAKDKKVNIFYCVVAKDQEKIANLFLKKGFNIDTKDETGRSLLKLSLEQKDIKTAQYLLSRGASLEGLDGELNYPIIKQAKFTDELYNLTLTSDAQITDIAQFNLDRLKFLCYKNGFIPNSLNQFIKTSECLSDELKQKLIEFIDNSIRATPEEIKEAIGEPLGLLIRTAYRDKVIVPHSYFSAQEKLFTDERMKQAKLFYKRNPNLTPNGFIKLLGDQNKRQEALSLLFTDMTLGEQIFNGLSQLTLEEDVWDIKKDFFDHELREDYLQRCNNILEDKLDKAHKRIRELESNLPIKKRYIQDNWIDRIEVGKKNTEYNAGVPEIIELR